MPSFRDLSGMTFGRLTVQNVHPDRSAGVRWVCRCSCGATTTLRNCQLTTGRAKSCGCLRRDVSAKAHTTHGHRQHPLYMIWRHMIVRCDDPADPGYRNYGGRGIVVCERWRGPLGLVNFTADMGERQSGLTLERIDNDGDYEPGNCRWASRKDQAQNRRSNRRLTHDGVTRTITEWGEATGLGFACIHARLKNGWDTSKALTTPKRA